MIKAYLFDWGDTLMVDFPNATGKMCNWHMVKAVNGAQEALALLAKDTPIYIATGAADSTELEIKLAFERVGLSQYISGYFCQANVGCSKGSSEFLETILSKLKLPAINVVMVGDNYDKDIKPALAVGIKPIWLTLDKAGLNSRVISGDVRVINRLSALL